MFMGVAGMTDSRNIRGFMVPGDKVLLPLAVIQYVESLGVPHIVKHVQSLLDVLKLKKIQE